MGLPAPNLDDRRFQDLVDDAKRLVQRRCPEWTDHNVSDPGVTLIETFAFMVDQLLFRLNRVPDRLYVKFLDLIGLTLLPPTAARTAVTFWLSAPQQEALSVAAGTEVATLRTPTDEAVTFTTVEDLAIIPSELAHLTSIDPQGKTRDQSKVLRDRGGFECFSSEPQEGDALLIGLDNAVPSCAIRLRFVCQVQGSGVDPLDPPIVWQAWDGSAWAPCDVDHDHTGGLNRDGDVVLHVPGTHVQHVVGRQRAGWVRCVVKKSYDGQPFYSASPRITRLDAFTVGGTAPALHSEVVREEILGLSEGTPGQRFLLSRRPVVETEPSPVVEVAGGAGWEEWTRVETFAESGRDDRHYVLDEVAGEVALGPAVRERDGSLTYYGVVPPVGAPIRIRDYRCGGGQPGNVARGAVRVLKTSIPYVSRVENRFPARGGVDGETLDAAKVRGPILLRTRNRAVTAEDYEELARKAAPDLARVHCIAMDGTGANAVRVLVVPKAPDNEEGRLAFEDLIPDEQTVKTVRDYLNERRLIGDQAFVQAPLYQGLTVVARLKASRRASISRVQADVLEALYGYFHPIRGGPDGTGWPFGRRIQIGEVYGTIQSVAGVELIDDAVLYGADPVTGKRGEATTKIDVPPNALAYSFEHQIRVEHL